MSAYPESFIKKFDVIERTFDTRKDTDAKKNRDKLARGLRRSGYTVETAKWEFPDLGPGTLYTLYATKPKEPTDVITHESA